MLTYLDINGIHLDIMTNIKLRMTLLLLHEFTLLPYAGFVDKLRFSADEEDYSQQKFIEWNSFSIDDEYTQSSSGTVHKTKILTLETIKNTDFLVIFGGRNIDAMLEISGAIKPFIRACLYNQVHIVGIDNSIFPLALLGIFNNEKVAVHWRHHDQFCDMFPKLSLAPDLLFYSKNKLSSCVGGTAAIDMAVSLLSPYVGNARAVKGLADMFIEKHRSNQDLADISDIPIVNDPILHRALLLINESISCKQTIEAISKQVGISRRQLDRKMISQFNVSASTYQTNRRIEQAKWLLINTSQSISSIAELVGFENLNYFRKAFKKRFQITPFACRSAIRKNNLVEQS